MNLTDIIAKIQKLRSLSTSSNVNEASTAASIADKLMNEYRLSEAQVSIETTEEDNHPEEADDFIYETGRITPWKETLVVILSRSYGCAICNHPIILDNRKYSRYKLYGRKSDIEIVNYMFTWLESEIARLVLKEGKGKGKVFCNSYCLGAVAGIKEQLVRNKEEQKKAAEASNQTEALVRLNSRYPDAYAFMTNQYHNIRNSKATGHSRINGDAYSQGQAQGRNIHLGKSMNSSNTKMLGN